MGLVALALGCPAPKATPTATPTDAPAAGGPAATPAPEPAAPSGPVVLFTIADGLLVPVLCHDGTELVDPETTACMELAPVGDPVVLDTDARITLGETADVACSGSLLNRFEGRTPAEGILGDGQFATWPAAASSALSLAEPTTLAPSPEELAAMIALLEKETEGLFEVRPKLEPTSGLFADLDADGKPDRVFATHESGRLYGVIAAFLAVDPKTPVPLSVMQFDAPRLVGTADLDHRPGHEVLVDAVFVEGIEGQDLVSAVSRRVYALHQGAPVMVGAWGCRIF